MKGKTSDPVCHITDTRCCKPNPANCIMLSHIPLYFPLLLSSSSPLLLSHPQLYHHGRTAGFIIPLYVTLTLLWVSTEFTISLQLTVFQQASLRSQHYILAAQFSFRSRFCSLPIDCCQPLFITAHR